MPTPVSVTDTSTSPSTRAVRTSMRPPSGVNLMASERKFSTTWRTLRSSAHTKPTSSPVAEWRAMPRRVARSRTSITALSTAAGRWKSDSSNAPPDSRLVDIDGKTKLTLD